MNIHTIWRRITTSRRMREREAAVQHENAQRENALREEFVRNTHVLEVRIAQMCAEIDRLRAENRALLNSVLGIAGIPPVIVADPPASFLGGSVAEETPTSGSGSADRPATPNAAGLPLVGARHAVPARPCPADRRAAGRPGADAWRDAAHSSALSSRQTAEVWPDAPFASRTVLRDEGSAVGVGGNEQMQIPRTTPRAPRDSGGHPNTARDSARDDNGSLNSAALPFVGASAAASCAGADACPNADHSTMFRGAGTPACVVSPLSPNDTSETAKRNTDKSVCATNRTRRARAARDPHAIAPIRRRSWHQIYRMLEFESSRRKEREP